MSLQPYQLPVCRGNQRGTCFFYARAPWSWLDKGWFLKNTPDLSGAFV